MALEDDLEVFDQLGKISEAHRNPKNGVNDHVDIVLSVDREGTDPDPFTENICDTVYDQGYRVADVEFDSYRLLLAPTGDKKVGREVDRLVGLVESGHVSEEYGVHEENTAEAAFYSVNETSLPEEDPLSVVDYLDEIPQEWEERIPYGSDIGFGEIQGMAKTGIEHEVYNRLEE